MAKYSDTFRKGHIVLPVIFGMSIDTITTFILNKLVSVSPGICYNKYEDKMFKATFTLSFWGLLRIGEIAFSKGNNAGQILAVDDVNKGNKIPGKTDTNLFRINVVIGKRYLLYFLI
jgi:hypothetical protein